MKLTIMFKDRTVNNIHVQIVWQDHTQGMDKLYYETLYDEKGKGTFVPINNILTWQISN
ncbi:MAG: hypothetical protein K0R54_257 [Clostridiaceae bacterium]|nr:hypothetical protein [Clostridiaceae bacterium]